MTPADRPLVLVEPSGDLPVVFVQVSLRSGSAFDPPGHDGLAWMTTEMLRRGAAGRSRAAIDETLDRLGADVSSSAGPDSISFTARVLRRNLDPLLEVFTDMVRAPDFVSDELERVRREMLAAIDEMRDDDRDLCGRYFARHLYQDHPYGRPSAGTESSLTRIGRDQVVAFHRGHFTRSNAVIGIAGDVDEPTIERVVSQLTNQLTPLASPEAVALPDVKPPAGRRVLVVDKPERTQVQMLLGHPAPRWGTPGYDALQVITTVFGGTFTGRLMKEVRVNRGLSYGAYASLHGGRGRGHVETWVFPAVGDAVATLELVLKMLDDLVAGGVSDDELEFARQHLIGHYPLMIETPERRLASRTDLAICGLPPDYLFRFPERMKAVDSRAARIAIAEHMLPRNLAITLVAQADQIVPQLEQARSRLHLDEITTIPFQRDLT
jgi:zinc protease